MRIFIAPIAAIGFLISVHVQAQEGRLRPDLSSLECPDRTALWMERMLNRSTAKLRQSLYHHPGMDFSNLESGGLYLAFGGINLPEAIKRWARERDTESKRGPVEEIYVSSIENLEELDLEGFVLRVRQITELHASYDQKLMALKQHHLDLLEKIRARRGDRFLVNWANRQLDELEADRVFTSVEWSYRWEKHEQLNQLEIASRELCSTLRWGGNRMGLTRVFTQKDAYRRFEIIFTGYLGFLHDLEREAQ